MRFVAFVAMLGAAMFGTAVGASRTFVGGQQFVLHDNRWSVLDASGKEWEVAPGRIFVRLRPGVTLDDARNSLSASSVVLDRRRKDERDFYRFRYSPQQDPPAVLSAVLSDSRVAAAFLDTRIVFLGPPNDEYYPQQWPLTEIRAERGWEVTTGSSDVTIAIIDDGVQYTHEDFVDVVWSNSREVPGDGVDNDLDWHGAARDVLLPEPLWRACFEQVRKSG